MYQIGIIDCRHSNRHCDTIIGVYHQTLLLGLKEENGLECPLTESSFARSLPAGRQIFVNTVIHWSPDTESRQDPALNVWTPMYYPVDQTLPASQPANFSQNCSECVGTLNLKESKYDYAM